jgi:hypothetical protein
VHLAWFSHSAGEPPQVLLAPLNPSLGHRPPKQNSALSHSPFAARHITPSRKTSEGQKALVPVHRSSASQIGSIDGRQTVTDDENPSGGHKPPEQASCSSQGPLTGRHTVPSDATFDRQVSSLPRQNTSTRQFDTDPVAHLCVPEDKIPMKNKNKQKKKKKKQETNGLTRSKSTLRSITTWTTCAFKRNCFDIRIARADFHACTIRASPRADSATSAIGFTGAHRHAGLIRT